MKAIVVETLESLKEYIPKMVIGCQSTVENLQGGNEAVALQLLPAIIEGFEWILQAISGLQDNGQLLDIELSNLSQHFQEMLNALEIGDYVLLADLLDYEIVPVMETWLAIINSVVI
jgi:hypothetical protein